MEFKLSKNTYLQGQLSASYRSLVSVRVAKSRRLHWARYIAYIWEKRTV